jgi:hypothetical protein
MKPLQAMGDKVRPICDRFWLFTIAGLSLGILGAIVFVAGFSAQDLPPDRLALLGSLSTGLLMLIQKVIEAQGTRQAMQQLHESSPSKGDGAAVDQMTVEADSVEVNKK